MVLFAIELEWGPYCSGVVSEFSPEREERPRDCINHITRRYITFQFFSFRQFIA